jgi:hypothetical protein
VPYPDPPPTVVPVEISIEPEGAPEESRRSNALSDNNARETSAAVLAMPSSSASPDIPATPPSSDWPGGVNAGHLLDLPAPPTFKSGTRSHGLDMLGTMLDCLTVEGFSRQTPGRPLREHPPCTWTNLPLRAPVTRFPTDEPEPQEGALWADEGYRTFETIRPMFDESLLPKKVPQANRALKKWFMELFP